jgi:heme exporter protein A
MTSRQVFSLLNLRATGLVCGRGGMALTRALDFSATPGHCLLLRGPNGSGKTTLLLTLSGIVAPLAGSFALEGADPDAGPQLHYCGHRNAIKPRLTVAENLGFWAAANGATGLPVQAALQDVGLDRLADLDAGYLSAGQSRRLALARLLVSHRPLWLLDEPTAALDSDGHALVTRLLDRHLDSGGMAIAATHDPIILPDPARIQTLTLGATP